MPTATRTRAWSCGLAIGVVAVPLTGGASANAPSVDEAVLGTYLRRRGSSESNPVGEAHDATGVSG